MNRTSLLIQPNNISNYEDILKLQKKYQNNLIENSLKKQLIWIGEHNTVYTIGRGGKKKNILKSLDQKEFDVLRIDRGGEVTCHMPGQLVVYLVLDLNHYKKDLNWFLRKIEFLIIKILREVKVEGYTKNGYTGVWCEDKKIASIGIGCKRWVTIHGFSINVNCNLDHFNKIIPCGIEGCSMVNIKDFNKKVDILEVKKIVRKLIKQEFQIEFISK